MTRLVVWMSLIGAVLAGTLIAIRQTGMAPELSSAAAVLARGADQCFTHRQNCWHGIEPGITTSQQAAAILLEDATFRADAKIPTQENRLCWSSVPDGAWHVCTSEVGNPIVYLNVDPPWDTFLLGDAVLRFGAPRYSVICDPYTVNIGSIRFIQSRQFVAGIIYFGNGIAALVHNPWQPQMLQLTPDMVVLRLIYYRGDPPRDASIRWRGFSQKTNTLGCVG